MASVSEMMQNVQSHPDILEALFISAILLFILAHKTTVEAIVG